MRRSTPPYNPLMLPNLPTQSSPPPLPPLTNQPTSTGGPTIQGLVPYFFRAVRPGSMRILERCTYNNMVTKGMIQRQSLDQAPGPLTRSTNARPNHHPASSTIQPQLSTFYYIHIRRTTPISATRASAATRLPIRGVQTAVHGTLRT